MYISPEGDTIPSIELDNKRIPIHQGCLDIKAWYPQEVTSESLPEFSFGSFPGDIFFNLHEFLLGKPRNYVVGILQTLYVTRNPAVVPSRYSPGVHLGNP